MSDSLPERLVGGARRRVGRLARRARTGRPSVTVVVELSGAEAQARAAAVDSVRDQALAKGERLRQR